MQEQDGEVQNLLDLKGFEIEDYNITTFDQFRDWLLKQQFLDDNQVIISSPTKRFQPLSLNKKKSINFLKDNEKNLSKLKYGLSITYNNKNHQNTLNVDDKSLDGSIRQMSAHSSRSVNGYQQINQYQIRDKIGKGAFSSVYLGVDVNTKKNYAIKVMQNKHLRKKLFRKNSSQIAQNFLNNQIAILKKLNHPFISKLYQVISDDDKKVYLILEYYQKGFINQSQNKSYRKLFQSECRRYFRQLALALDYIHNQAKIAHRDIKPQNILLSNSNQVKLSDFGLSTVDMKTYQKSGTKAYLAPQVSQSNDFSYDTQALDIWALGVTLIVLLTGKVPLQVNQSILIQTFTTMKIQASKQMMNFIHQCCEIDPTKRIRASQILVHSWIIGQGQPLINKAIFQILITKEDQETAIKKKQFCKPKKITVDWDQKI